MQLLWSPSFLVACLWLPGIATASRIPQASKRQDGAVVPSTAKDCTYFDTAVDKTYTCKYFEQTWGLSAADFLDWNPSVKSDCSGIKVGNSYCVEVNNGLPRPTTTTATKKTTTAPTKSSSTVTTKPGTTPPSPTQAGLTTSCTAFYKAAKGDSCWDIVNVKYADKRFTLDNFYAWNPTVGTDCHGLLAGYYYCVGVVSGSKTTTNATTKKPGTTTTPKTTTTKKTTPATTTTTKKPTSTSCTNKVAPTPTQPGTLCACKKWHLVKAGDTCEKLEKQYNVKEADFLKWNPQVGRKACGTLWGGYNVCVGA